GYYAARRAWDMAPGYERDPKPDFSRPITPECLFCHASGARAEPGTLNRVASLGAIEPIGCERCHGEGSAHAARPKRDNIVKPACNAMPAPTPSATARTASSATCRSSSPPAEVTPRGPITPSHVAVPAPLRPHRVASKPTTRARTPHATSALPTPS